MCEDSDVVDSARVRWLPEVGRWMGPWWVWALASAREGEYERAETFPDREGFPHGFCGHGAGTEGARGPELW